MPSKSWESSVRRNLNGLHACRRSKPFSTWSAAAPHRDHDRGAPTLAARLDDDDLTIPRHVLELLHDAAHGPFDFETKWRRRIAQAEVKRALALPEEVCADPALADLRRRIVRSPATVGRALQRECVPGGRGSWARAAL